MDKNKFRARFEKRIPARWHMSLICLLTIASGILLSKTFLYFQLSNPALRYFLAVLFSYGLFFGLIYIWLRWHFGPKDSIDAEPAFDGVDFFTSGDPGIHLSGGTWNGGGGQFSGGGASGSWDSSAQSTLTSSSGESSIFKEASSSAGDLDEGIIVLLIIAVLVAVFGGTFYIIYQAPEILFEAAFEALLVASMMRRAKKMESEGWAFSILKRTWIPFAIVLVLATSFGYLIKTQCPEAISFAQYRTMCWE